MQCAAEVDSFQIRVEAVFLPVGRYELMIACHVGAGRYPDNCLEFIVLWNEMDSGFHWNDE